MTGALWDLEVTLAPLRMDTKLRNRDLILDDSGESPDLIYELFSYLSRKAELVFDNQG